MSLGKEKQISAMVDKLIKNISIQNRKNALIIERMMTHKDEEEIMIKLSYILEKMKNVCENI